MAPEPQLPVVIDADHVRQIKLLLLAIVGLIVVAASVVGYTVVATADKADRNSQTISELQDQTIKRERICSETNMGACSALFDRLADNLTAAQRRRLACDVFAYFEEAAPAILAAREAKRCPAPLPAPPSAQAP